jgi:hypothetical protein
MEAATRASARQRGGLLRRLGRQNHSDIDEFSPSDLGNGSSEIIDIGPISEPDLGTLSFRVERLEAGVRLIVETMKRTYGDLASSIESLAQQLDVADARAMVERIVAEETGPLTTSIHELADAVQRFPHILAAAMDDLGLRMDSGRWKFERTLNDGLEALRQLASPGDGNGRGQAPLTPRPFELEPVEQQFGETNGSG